MFVKQRGGKTNVEATDYCPESKAHEELVCLQTDAVACPRTVVIHPHNALSTNRTMMSSWRLDVLALFAKPKANK
jgi:hypothetical protein